MVNESENQTIENLLLMMQLKAQSMISGLAVIIFAIHSVPKQELASTLMFQVDYKTKETNVTGLSAFGISLKSSLLHFL